MIITNNNHEFMRPNAYIEIDHENQLINGKFPFLYALNDHETLVLYPHIFDKLKLDIMEKLNEENSHHNR